ncbi:PhzF family phenazine biosynthesis protein [Lentzea sp. BCCO 10_0856]|uniref:PhzF family phenazine biosynthesis protein n=1 Tax=Lentzea miocenica TaxID=3095431 RepID=A0ABU4T4J6_9PSEU|nr:PhzF family phenazine biosynthesis protein [Lentzea sp. BCCO 10_0856]MDX8033081.1 PhzF family phenazine biosynthesis protein [Lentzea sp. BCCO 10_0856]
MIVNACLRDGRGGSPTAVVRDGDFTDAERQTVPGRCGTSHAVFVGPGNALRFFTSEGELPGCGHGTVAALAVLAAGGGEEFTLRAGGRTFRGTARRVPGGVEGVFDPGPVQVRAATTAERDAVVAALGAGGMCVVATLGRPRMLVELSDGLAALTPDFRRLRAATDEFGLLGCYVYSPEADGRYAARMFAPSIGVPEDIANANSTACLAAHLAADIAVDMGDSLGRPATITATASGPGVLVGGLATVVA